MLALVILVCLFVLCSRDFDVEVLTINQAIDLQCNLDMIEALEADRMPLVGEPAPVPVDIAAVQAAAQRALFVSPVVVPAVVGGSFWEPDFHDVFCYMFFFCLWVVCIKWYFTIVIHWVFTLNLEIIGCVSPLCGIIVSNITQKQHIMNWAT